MIKIRPMAGLKLLGSLVFPSVIGFLLGLNQLQGINGQQDAPFERPMENVTVKVGETAVFTCRVRPGKAQAVAWNHNDDLVYLKGQRQTGEDHRYSYSEYNGPTGKHQLFIANVTEQDDGLVRCDVFGGTNDNDWSSSPSYLNILAPPSDMAISAPSSSLGGVVKVRMDELVNLSCIAHGGKPTPKLVWLRGSQKIDGDTPYALGEGRDNTATYSSLLFKATPVDNNADFTCQAESPALEKPNARTIRMNVLYPPAVPVIRGVGEKKRVRVGDTDFSLTCVSEGGNPTPQLTWFRNNIAEESSHSSPLPGTRSESTSTLTFVPRIADNNAVLKCEAVNDLMPRGVYVQTILEVNFGPSTITLKAPTEVKPESSLELSCLSGPSNPAAVVTWKINNKPYYDEKSGHVQPGDDGSFNTLSTVKLVLRPGEYNDIAVTCQAVNPVVNEVSRSSIIIQVLPKVFPSEASSTNQFNVFDADNKELFSNSSVTPLNTNSGPDQFTVMVAVSASVGGAVFVALLGCLIYVTIRGKAKEFEEISSSDSSGSSKGHTEVSSQNGMESSTDTTGSDGERSSTDMYSHPKKQISASVVRTNAASTYLLDDPGHSPYETYRHWTAPEPGIHDFDSEFGVDYDGDGDYIEVLRRTAMQSLRNPPRTHSPSPLRPIPNHIIYEPASKASLLSTFHGQHLPTYRAEALAEELKGHLV